MRALNFMYSTEVVMNPVIGKTIKMLRSKRGLSQEKLAEHLGIAPQSVSKWEREEGYPDITLLIPLAEYFGVSLDLLMGRDGEENERKILSIKARMEHYRHMGDHESKNKLVREAYAEFPFDFRVITWYVASLFDTENIQANRDEIQKLCKYMLNECTEDAYRYEAITFLAELYSQCDEPDKAMEYVGRLPDMQSCREFAGCCIYPNGSERDFHAMADFIEGAMERLIWLACRMGVQRSVLKTSDRIRVLEQIRSAAHAVYPDFDFGICHSSMADTCLCLFRFYTESGRTTEALDALRDAFRHEKALDDCSNDEITHTSPLLRGHTFDMKTTWDGSKCNGVWWLLERLQDPHLSFDIYKGNKQYQNILDEYRPFAVEDKTLPH